MTVDARSARPGTQAHVADIVARLAAVTGSATSLIPLHEPEFNGAEWAYVKECLDSAQVSTTGAFVTRFEEELARAVGARHAVATVNGTAALHTALMLLGVRQGDEVLVPALSFVAAANATSHCGAIPHFVDTGADTLDLDVPKLAAHLSRIAVRRRGVCVNQETGRRIAALVVLHAFGHPADLDRVAELCEQCALPLVEDAAQALGSSYKGRHVGTTGRVGILSFNGNKILTTGGGGAILTNDTRLAEEAKHLTTTGRVRHRWTIAHDRVAFNYRMPNINAALGCAQLEQLASKVQRKRRLARRYLAAFAGAESCRVVSEPAFGRSNYWLNVLLVEQDSPDLREALLAATHDAGILTRRAWTPMHLLPPFTASPRMDLTGAERLFRRIITLPSSAGLAGHADAMAVVRAAAPVSSRRAGGVP